MDDKNDGGAMLAIGLIAGAAMGAVTMAGAGAVAYMAMRRRGLQPGGAGVFVPAEAAVTAAREAIGDVRRHSAEVRKALDAGENPVRKLAAASLSYGKALRSEDLAQGASQSQLLALHAERETAAAELGLLTTAVVSRVPGRIASPFPPPPPGVPTR